jgi:hypothetical protein
MSVRIRCHVLEVPTHDDWLSRRGGGPRELLPWADPYIAGLMRNLEDRYGRQAKRDERPSDRSDPFIPDSTADLATYNDDGWQDDGWQEDAFMPRPLEAPRFHTYPPVYGEFPLLNDLDRGGNLEP